MKRPNTPPAVAQPTAPEPQTHWHLNANARTGEFVLLFSSGPAGNVSGSVAFTPEQAERLARRIQEDLADFPERVAKVAKALAGGTT